VILCQHSFSQFLHSADYLPIEKKETQYQQVHLKSRAQKNVHDAHFSVHFLIPSAIYNPARFSNKFL
jgi:hypothetical protein